MRAHTDDVGGECACGCAQDQLEAVFKVDFQAGEFGRGICEGVRYGLEPLAVSIDVQRPQLCSSELNWWPFQCNGGLSDVPQLTDEWIMNKYRVMNIKVMQTAKTDLQPGGAGRANSKALTNLVLQRPELSISPFLLVNVLLHGDVDDGTSRRAWRQKYRWELNQMSLLPKENLVGEVRSFANACNAGALQPSPRLEFFCETRRNEIRRTGANLAFRL